MSDCAAYGDDGPCGRLANGGKRPFLYRRMTCYRDPRFSDDIAVVWASDEDEAMALLSAEYEHPRRELLSEMDPSVPVTVISR